MSTTPFRWGVIGATSKIYRGRLAPAMVLAGHPVVAEATRQNGSEEPYFDVLRSPEVDGVYIPLPNHRHADWIHHAIDAGKHVLCEKPLTMTEADTRSCYEHAAAAGVTLVEAYMWPHSPRSELMLSLARDGALGTLRHHHGAFSFLLEDHTNHRADERGAGALFDVGVYAIGPAVLLAGRDPVATAASARRNEHGADLNMTGWLDFGNGFTASFEVSFDGPHRRAQDLRGSAGGIHITHMSAPGPEDDGELIIERGDDPSDTVAYRGANSFALMLQNTADVARGLAAPKWTPDDSIRLARIEDQLHGSTRP